MKTYILTIIAFLLVITLPSKAFANSAKEPTQANNAVIVEIPDISFSFAYSLTAIDNMNIDELIAEAYTETTYAYAQSDSRKQNSSNSSNKFDNLGNIKGVDVVYISKSMLGMMPNMSFGNMKVKSITGKIQGLQIFSAESKNAARELKKASLKYIQDGKYETLMHTKDDSSTTSFYQKKAKNSNESELIMYTEDEGEVTIIRFLGDIDLNDLQK